MTWKWWHRCITLWQCIRHFSKHCWIFPSKGDPTHSFVWVLSSVVDCAFLLASLREVCDSSIFIPQHFFRTFYANTIIYIYLWSVYLVRTEPKKQLEERKNSSIILSLISWANPLHRYCGWFAYHWSELFRLVANVFCNRSRVHGSFYIDFW